MNLEDGFAPGESYNWICPDLTADWKLGKLRNSDEFVLQSLEGNRRIRFSATEGYALQSFTGRFTVGQVQERCQQQLGNAISPDFVSQLLSKLVVVDILTLSDAEESPTPGASGSVLKACVQWIKHPDGYWILRNPEDVTFIQVDDTGKAVISDLGQRQLEAIAQKYNISTQELRKLLQQLAATGMLVGTKPQKPSRGKFTPMQLLFFKLSLFNPDRWLSRHVDKLHWIWTRTFALLLCFFLGWSSAIAFSHSTDILLAGQQLMRTQGGSLMLPFGLLAMLVVTLHELGHAFTLKYYGGIVPEVGMMFMFLIPAAYTNTTDAYCLVKRRQRVLVVAAGVICQVAIAAGAFWMWQISSMWLHTTSFLLMAAALFTVAVNLNPLSKFDGYYLAVAMSGINNLRSRSFGFYGNLLQGRSTNEKPGDQAFLAAYAPFSLLYSLLVFGSLLGLVTGWTLTNIPTIAIILLTLWAIYFYWPSTSKTMTSNAPTPRPQPQLKVVPPTTTPSTTPSVTPATPPASVVASKPNSLKKWITISVVLVGISGLGLIQVPNSVPGEAEVTSTTNARQAVTAKLSGIVKEIYVSHNQQVTPGQTLAILFSKELEDEIAKAQQEAAQAKLNVKNYEQQLNNLQSQVKEADVNETNAQQQVEQVVEKIAQGNSFPQIRGLEHQIDEIEEEITGVNNQIEKSSARLKRYQSFEKGVIPLNDVEDIEKEVDNFSSLKNKHQKQIATKKSEIETIKQQLQEQLAQRQGELKRIQAVRQSILQQVENAKTAIQNQQEVAIKMDAEIPRREEKKKLLELKSETAGIVIAEKIDLMKNNLLKEGEPLLEIFNPNKLSISIKVPQEDKDLLKVGASVKFFPRDAGGRKYTGKVQEISSTVAVTETQPKPTLSVRILIDQPDLQLQPGMKGYGHIESESMPLYKKAQRELLKLVQPGLFGIG
ncbi:efflux RND transporter periplasmic adaptor subunit [Trichocoleus sp. DQ-A3]|uniref:efflux RND transporter periplasmic adaptor subunit n=1 Tax=Cyanophyceae TaxID=3028117 RepID=UPI0016875A4A|nr:efflux RND transporter periplasmic adaptor subunit [Coleofasciculus sp. FACHB-125]MBD1903892.1 efflux RND transporter periplasmic adaptor subunit [Coleofasciculus sp. FACHB-125]